MEYNEIIKNAYYYDKTGMLLKGDCLDWMAKFPDKSVDMILCDLPYGTTACKWDVVISFDKLWEQYKRIVKSGGAILLFGREPFTSVMVNSNINGYKHKWVWNKKQSGSFQNAKYMPLQIEEDIICFTANGEKVLYYPQMRTGVMRKRGGAKEKSRVVGEGLKDGYENYSDQYFPVNIIEFANPRIGKLHPTQKPIEILEALVKNYTLENHIVLDNTAGVCSTAIACKNTNRKWICIEKEEEYCAKSVERIRSLTQ